MSELILFTIIATFAGVYTLFPKYKQARLYFSISSFARCLGIIGLLTVLITVPVGAFVTDSNSFIRSPEWIAVDYLVFGEIHLGIEFLADTIQMLSVLAISSYLFYILSATSVNVSDWNEFGAKVRDLRDNQHYPQLADLLNDHYDEILYLTDEVPDEVEGIIEESIMNKDVITTCASARPEFILRIITDRKVDLIDREQFSDIFLRYLITNNDSLLYSEIRNLEKLHGYSLNRIPDRYRVLSSLLADCSLEEDLSIGRSIGEPTIDYLRDLPNNASDPYNTRSTRFTTSPADAIPSVYEDRVYLAIQYFDLAVREALHQDYLGHMWMYYYYYFFDEICNNYKQIPQSNRTDEWNSDYQYLVWKMIDNNIRWISVSELRWYNSDFVFTNNKKSVIQSSIDVLFQVHQRLLGCDDVPVEFKRKMSHKIIDGYFDLKMSNNQDSEEIGDMMNAHISGITSGTDRETIDYRRQFASHLSTANISYLHYSQSSKARQIRNNLEQAVL